MPQLPINRINFIAKRQKSIKGLNFGDSQNRIDLAIIIGVMSNNINKIISKELQSDITDDNSLDNDVECVIQDNKVRDENQTTNSEIIKNEEDENADNNQDENSNSDKELDEP